MEGLTVWHGLLGGAAIGLYVLLQLRLSGHALGVSTGLGSVVALLSRRAFFRQAPYDERWSWRLFFLLGIPLGGALALFLSPAAGFEASLDLGARYEAVMPKGILLRVLLLGMAGFAMGFGARWAGGCTSGHAISGLAMLNPASLLAAIGFFVGGAVAVGLLFALAT